MGPLTAIFELAVSTLLNEHGLLEVAACGWLSPEWGVGRIALSTLW
jgi:hypothetical protein